jgi:hypothetical protein
MSVADPHLAEADPDTAFHFEADPVQNFHFYVIRIHIKVMYTKTLQTLDGSIVSLQSFSAVLMMNLDPAFH